jgi:hypothetical protein
MEETKEIRIASQKPLIMTIPVGFDSSTAIEARISDMSDSSCTDDDNTDVGSVIAAADKKRRQKRE